MTVMDRWMLVMGELRLEMSRRQITERDVEQVIERQSTGKCKACTGNMCCDFMRLFSLTWGALHAAHARSGN